MLSDSRLYQIFVTRTAKILCLTLMLQEGKSSFIVVHGCYCFHVAERTLTDLYPQDERSVCTQI